MKTPLIYQFIAEVHACAMQMMNNAAFIQKELPSLEMPDSLRDQIAKLCSDLIGSKHDLISEATELEEIMEVDTDLDRIARRVKMIQGWIHDDVLSIHQCVESVENAVKNGTVDSLVSLLLTESAVNILNAVPTAPDVSEEVESEFQQDEIDEEDEDEDDSSDCYGFYSEDSYPIGILIDAISNLMKRPEIESEAMGELRVFLFAMERLPLITPGVSMSLGLRLDQGGESDWIEIRMEDGEFSLGRGSWIDGDASTETVFEVGSGYREGDAFIATQFAESFSECAEDGCRDVVIEDTSDEPFNEWDLEKDKSRWGSLPCSFL